MKFVAATLTLWLALRSIGLLVGLVRTKRVAKSEEFRKVARRACTIRFLLNTALAVVVVYAWSFVAKVQPVEFFVSILAAILMISITSALMLRMMQPQDLDERLCKLFKLDS